MYRLDLRRPTLAVCLFVLIASAAIARDLPSDPTAATPGAALLRAETLLAAARDGKLTDAGAEEALSLIHI